MASLVIADDAKMVLTCMLMAKRMKVNGSMIFLMEEEK